MNKDQIIHLIQAYLATMPDQKKIKKLSLFGSYLTGTQTEESDIDFLVEFSPEEKVGFFQLMEIKENLEKQLNHNIDFVTPQSLSPYIKDSIIKTAEVIYEK